jgi:hypothetical protein
VPLTLLKVLSFLACALVVGYGVYLILITAAWLAPLRFRTSC